MPFFMIRLKRLYVGLALFLNVFPSCILLVGTSAAVKETDKKIKGR